VVQDELTTDVTEVVQPVHPWKAGALIVTGIALLLLLEVVARPVRDNEARTDAGVSHGRRPSFAFVCRSRETEPAKLEFEDRIRDDITQRVRNPRSPQRPRCDPVCSFRSGSWLAGSRTKLPAGRVPGMP
jgi:hypothetical protein